MAWKTQIEEAVPAKLEGRFIDPTSSKRHRAGCG